MTTTLSDMTAKKKPELSAEEIAAKELVRLAEEQGLSLTGPDGLLKQFTPVAEVWICESVSTFGPTGLGLDSADRRPRLPQ